MGEPRFDGERKHPESPAGARPLRDTRGVIQRPSGLMQFPPRSEAHEAAVRSRLARREEPEVADGIRDAFTSEGIAMIEGAGPTRCAETATKS